MENRGMRYGFVIPGGDILDWISLAVTLEAAGWDAVFVADLVYGPDPWVALAALATQTSTLRLGPLITPVARRRPWKLASETATLDHLSAGRVILAVGLGAIDTGFDQVGEVIDRRVRAEYMDEGLELVTRFWQGQPFVYQGKHYQVNWTNSMGSYVPIQQPRIPIWVVGAWPYRQTLARARHYDGLIASTKYPDGRIAPSLPDEIRAIRSELDALSDHEGHTDTPRDLIIEGVSPLGDRAAAAAHVRSYSEAGATWWIESMWEEPGGMAAVVARALQGPPR